MGMEFLLPEEGRKEKDRAVLEKQAGLSVPGPRVPWRHHRCHQGVTYCALHLPLSLPREPLAAFSRGDLVCL